MRRAEGSAEVEVTAARLEAVAEPEVDAKTLALSWFGTACFVTLGSGRDGLR